MPPFNDVVCDTVDLHYGVANEVSPKQSPEEACTSPLLLDVETAETQVERHNASTEAEYRKLQQETRTAKNAGRSISCVKVLLALGLWHTVVTIAFVSESAAVAIPAMFLFAFLLRRLSKQKAPTTRLVVSILAMNLSCIALIQTFLGADFTLVFAGTINGMSALVYCCHTRSAKGTTTSTTTTKLEKGQLRQKELFCTYLGTIKSVANGVYNNYNNPQKSTELREFFPDPPLEGFYGTDDKDQLFLLFPPSDSPKGWWIRGVRQQQSDLPMLQSVVLEGFVSPTHEAYWTEGTLDGTQNTLYYGKFVQGKQFTGEWLSYKGKRCHQYRLELRKQADPEEHLGVCCNQCGRKVGPGTCYTAKARNCFYCQSCVEDTPSLIEDDFVALQLPEVSRRPGDQPYDPPCASEN